MLELINKILYFLSLYGTWQILHKAIFVERRKERRITTNILRFMILLCLHVICEKTLLTNILIPIIVLFTYYLLSRVEYDAPRKPLIIESALSYMASTSFSFLAIPISTALCHFMISLSSGGQVPQDIIDIPYFSVTIIKSILGIVVCMLVWRAFKHKNLSAFSSNVSSRIFLIITALYLIVYMRIRIPNRKIPVTSNETLLFATLVFFIALALFFVSAMREHEVLTDREKAEAEIQEKAAQLSETKDELYYIKSENHKLNKTLPALEHKYTALEETARSILDSAYDTETPYDTETAAEIAFDLKQQQHILKTIQQKTEAENRKDHFEIELDLTTGLASVDTYLEYQSKYMLEQGIMFDCIISEKPDCDKLGLNELDFHQIAANLLSNAVHAVEQQTEGRRAVILTMGPQGEAYQIKVTDSGVPFPPSILQDLGRMGNTTDGNGVGYVTLLRILRDCGGSLSIEAYDPPSISGLTKRVVIRFDGRGRIAVLSPGAPEALRNGRGVADLLGETE